MKIAIAQFNPRVGDLSGNYLKAQKMVEIAKEQGADLVVFPELSVLGYPPKDLLDKATFVSEVEKYSGLWAGLSTDQIGILFGSVIKTSDNEVKPLQNVAMLALGGKVISGQAKRLLPTYDVFDEDRYFTPAYTINPMLFKGVKLGVSICEDTWNCKTFWEKRIYKDDPIEILCSSKPDILINISASPYCLGKEGVRRDMLSHIAKRFGKTFIYCNQIGGNDDVVYDGRSLIISSKGEIIEELPAFVESVRTYDVATIETSEPAKPAVRCQPFEIYEALVRGTADYANKTGFKKAVIGLSGGVDSALVAVIAAEALGKENVLGVGMPSSYSSEGSVTDARALAEKLGIEFTVIPIELAHNAYKSMLDQRLIQSHCTCGIPAWQDAEHPKECGIHGVRVWEENIQARIRGATLMAISNDENRLLLTTGNKSEVAVGYCTLYGDTCGGLAVISDVYKTTVYDVVRWINHIRMMEIVPEATINKPPSAELRPGQYDQQSLPPYPVLDAILKLYIEESLEIDEIEAQMKALHVNDNTIHGKYDRALIAKICRMVDMNEYKRKQLAPGIKITRKAFGTGRQMPIAQGWRQ